MSNSIRLVAILALVSAMASCTKAVPGKSGQGMVKFTLISGEPVSKTGIESAGSGKYLSFWHSGDKLSAWNKGQTVTEFMTLENTQPDGRLAVFSGSGLAAESGTIRAFYPSGAVDRADADYVYFTTKDVQYPTATSFDPEADRLLSKEYPYQTSDGAVLIDDMRFHRLMTVLKVNLLGSDFSGEVVKSVKLVFSQHIGGRFRSSTVDMETTAYSNNVNTVTAILKDEVRVADANGGAVYVIVPPGQATNQNYNGLSEIEVITDSHLLKKSFSDVAIQLNPSEMAVVNITLSQDHLVKEEGVYLTEYSSSGEQVSDGKFVIHQNLKGVLCHPDGYQVKIDQDYDFEFDVVDSGTNLAAVTDEAVLSKTAVPSFTPNGGDKTTFERDGKFVKTLVRLPYRERWSADGFISDVALRTRILSYIDTDKTPTYSIDFPGIEESVSFAPDHVIAEWDESRSNDSKTVYKVTCYYRIGVSRSRTIDAALLHIDADQYYFTKTHYREYVK